MAKNVAVLGYSRLSTFFLKISPVKGNIEVMRNSLSQGTVSIVIYGNEGKYTGICREFGFVEEGKTAEEVERRMGKSVRLLLETVAKNPRLEPSLNVSPPFKYLLMFYWISISYLFAKMMYDTQ